MEILSFVRGPHRVEVVIRENGKISGKKFPRMMTYTKIMAALKGEEPPAAPEPAAPAEPPAEFVKTVPEPPAVTRERLTIPQMIAELEAAGVTSVKATDKYLTVKSAYEKMKQAEAQTL